MIIPADFHAPALRSGVLAADAPPLAPGVERWPVPGGGSRTIPVEAGDEIAVVDAEGLQPAELAFFDREGRSDAAMLGAAGGADARGLAAALAADASGRAALAALERAGCDLSRADLARLFAEGSRAGETARFAAERDGLLTVRAPGGPMSPEAQDAPTELLVFIRRANPRPGKGRRAPPPPLAEPLTDINIAPGEARAYEVRAGQYVQILDVQGRECSDWQAFALRDLDRGLEREIDPTATRSMTGLAYPRPGLASKYWTVDFQPLAEIVQDTVGRHDAFNLACTARYYEDLGYPGHVNCTDNINADMARWSVRARSGWPAINFFYNTMLDAANGVGMDEPWSRPGDYVLARATTDLVCVSTACPCDVDPANGWEPTDIQVRVYDASLDARRSIGWRKTPDSDVEMTRETGFHARFAARARDFAEYNGFWLANAMTGGGPIEEHRACREAAAIMDLSALRKYEVTGPDAETLMQLCATRDMRKLAVGQVAYTAICHEHGGMIDDGTAFRLGETNYRWVGGCDESGLHLRRVAEERKLNAWVRCSTDQLNNVAVQGPRSREILAEVFWTPPAQPTVEELGWFRFAVARVGGFDGPACVVSRTGYTGELGYEVFCHPKDAEAVFDAIWAAGEPRGLAALGLAALDILRIEAGLPFAGREFCARTDPMEAGIGFAVPLKSKTEDFIGREALARRKETPQRRLVGLALAGGVVPDQGDPVRVGSAEIGEITSATRSPSLGRVIALARVDLPHGEIGQAVEVGRLDGRSKRLAAEIVRFPHFDPEKRRVRGDYGG